MKAAILLLLLVCNSTLAVALSKVCSEALGAHPVSLFYHEREGIPAARRIRDAEAGVKAGRVAGGQPAPLGAHPYLAGLLVSLTIGQTSVCGASLLSNTRLLTAAHCWFDGLHQGNLITAVLGSTTLFSGGTRVTSQEVAMHGNYNPRNLNNDIALITIPAVAYTNVIQPIALPTGYMSWFTFEYNWGVVPGYGVTTDSENITQNQSQRHVNVMVVNNLDCATVYGFNVISSTICTSGQGRVGPCGGDSGGPLVVTFSGQPYLVGVVSFHAAGGCDIGFPGGYARVTSFLSWIQNRL